MKILITGITGMVGSHLADYIVNNHQECSVSGLVRWRSPTDNIRHLLKEISLHEGDLRDLNSLIKIINDIKPDRIFHLAAQSYVNQSFIAPTDTMYTNIIGTNNLLDAVRICKIAPRIHICSSSEVYGQVLKEETPINETNALRPASPYAVSKVGEDMLALQYYLSYDMHIIRTRMFTHTGPRRGDVFAESSFAKQIAQIELNVKTSPVFVGNLESVRTISDVRDAVKAYWLLLEKCKKGDVYNIGGTEILTIKEVLDILKSLSTVKIKHEISKSLLRPSDVTLQIPDISKFTKETNWKPKISVKTTLLDLLNFHRKKLKNEK